MTFWNVNKLAVALKREELSEWNKTKYYIATLFLQMLLGAVSSFYFGWGGDFRAVIATILAALLSYFCILGIYKSCEKHEEISILEALTVLGFPVSVMLQVFYWGTYLVMLSAFNASLVSQDVFAQVFLILIPVYSVLFFALINSAINRLDD
jgi:hypothetical protein